jgi:microcystin degradation protein MlrC
VRVGVVCLSHESNTFLPALTERGRFDVCAGDAVRSRWAATNHEVAGFLDGIASSGHEAVPVFTAVAMPSGRIADEALSGLVEELIEQVEHLGPFDGILAAAHGAAVAEGHDDADGYWLGRLRATVGIDVPIVATVDAHANLSPAMLEATDALIAYRTNPHLDTRARGIEAADLLARTMAGAGHPVQRGAFPPLAINILQQATSEPPCRAIVDRVEAVRRRPGVLSASLLLGFPYADVLELGSSFVVVTDGDPELAASAADELAAELLSRRADFRPRLTSPSEAVGIAAGTPHDARPVCLLDMGDNIGGGSAADGTTLAHLLAARGDLRAFVPLYDPDASAQAHALGIGATAGFVLGGKTDALHGSPLAVTARVDGLHPGPFREADLRHGGNDRFDMGRTAILSTATGLTIQVVSERVPAFSLSQITSCGLDPRAFDVIVAKGVHSPVPAYGPVCPTMIRVDTPGSTAADMTTLPFRSRRSPLFPFEELAEPVTAPGDHPTPS